MTNTVAAMVEFLAKEAHLVSVGIARPCVYDPEQKSQAGGWNVKHLLPMFAERWSLVCWAFGHESDAGFCSLLA